MKIVCERPRTVPVVEAADVIVCGGGPAGIAAALASARLGVKTTLLEAAGCLGGVWTSGLLSWILDAKGKPGLMEEIRLELEQRGAAIHNIGEKDGIAYDPEQMKLLLEKLCLNAGIHVRLHTRVVMALRDPQGDRLTTVITESKSGREAWSASIYIDATGDGDLAAYAGCRFDMGRPDSGETQPMSMIALVTGIHYEEIREYVGGGEAKPKQMLYELLERHGSAPSNSVPLLLRINDDLYALCANHEYNVSPIDAEKVTQATIRGRAEAHRLVETLRRIGGPWRKIRIVATASQIGVREGRRVRGKYTITENDVYGGTRHDDAVCEVRFPVDVHSTNPEQHKGIEQSKRESRSYDIPLRALIANDVNGLLLAGRCISGDFIAHSSYRVTGNAVAMGEASGMAAALSVQRQCLPQELTNRDIAAIQNRTLGLSR